MMKIKLYVFCLAFIVFKFAAAQNNPCLPGYTINSNKQYLFTAWVAKLEVLNESSYQGISIELRFEDELIGSFEPKGALIDGWQKIEGRIEGLFDVGVLELTLLNTTASDFVALDDVRIQPIDASMTTYVYDPESFRLVAELDENHYAKFYDYDSEGKLARIRKETERGVKTIMESRIYTK